MNKIILSTVIPIYNGASRVDNSYQQLKIKVGELTKNKRIKDQEVIFIDNNSNDGSLQKIKAIEKNDRHVFVLQTEKRGIGLALKKGLAKAKGDYIYFTAIDHPFNFGDLDKFLKIIDKYDLIYASKNHPQSVYKAPFKRKLASFMLSNTVRLLFNLPLTDTQGTFMIKKDTLERVLPFCNSPGPFFQAQLAINAKRFGLQVGEVPVNYQTKSNSSSFPPRDALIYLYEVIKERICYRKYPDKSFPSA